MCDERFSCLNYRSSLIPGVVDRRTSSITPLFLGEIPGLAIPDQCGLGIATTMPPNSSAAESSILKRNQSAEVV